MEKGPSEPGKPLGGRYQVIQLLGMGGFGQTFLAQDLHLPGHPRCVVKQLKPQVNNPQELQVARRLFDTEAQVLYRLGSHPQIPSLLAHFEEDQEFYLVQELIAGHSLEEELEAGEAMVEDRSEWAIAFLHDLLSTLAFVHDHQVIHRDIKPSNLIRRHSDRRLVLIDFGAVKQVSTRMTLAPSSLNRTISIGTEGYMPGEQLAGRPQFSSDVYAVGMIAIQGLTGYAPHRIPTHPHSGELDWHGLWPHGHPVLGALLDSMVQYDFRSRYGTAAEALTALRQTFPQFLDHLPAGGRDLSDDRALKSSAQASPSRAVPTIAVGRRPQPPTGSRADSNRGPDRPRPRPRRQGHSILPVGLGLVALLGVGIFAWRHVASSPPVEPASQSTDSAADATPESASPVGVPREPLEPDSAPASVADPEPGSESPPASPEPVAADLEDATEPPTPGPTEPEAPENPESAVALSPETAQATVSSLYGYVSAQSWDTARGLFGESLAQQFDPGFFEQFEQVTVDNLQVTHQSDDSVELVGRNTYYYPDGSRQQEERTFRVQMVEGQPRIVGSDFVQVLQPRSGE